MSDAPQSSDPSSTTPTTGSTPEVKVLPHDFDGIRELDNDTPWWFHALFFGTVGIAVLYALHYHFGPGLLGDAKFKADDAALQELRVKNATGPLDEAQLRGLLGSADRLTKGKEAYASVGCAACHGMDGTGTVGPNLLDRSSLYGNSLEAIRDSIAKGRNNGMMPANAGKLSDDQIANLTLWIGSEIKKGGKPGKAPDAAREKDSPVDY